MLSLKYALTKEDYRKYYTFVTWSSPEKKRKRLIHYGKQIAFSLLIIGVIIYLNVFTYNRRIGYWLIGYVLFSLVYSLISSHLRIQRSADIFADNPENASIFSETQVDVSEEGIVVKDEYNLTNSSWLAFIKKEETKDHYYLFRNSLDALIVPKRIFKSALEKEAFEKYLRRGLTIDAEIAVLRRE